MNSTKRTARVAGLLYLLMSIPGAFSLMYVPGALIVPGNATVTASNILAQEMLSRIGIVAGLFASVMFTLLAMALHRLFSGVNKTYASRMWPLVLLGCSCQHTGVSFSGPLCRRCLDKCGSCCGF
jgi:uncharacterized protein DUF4386